MKFKRLILIYLFTGISVSLLFAQEQQFNTPNQLWTEPDTRDFKDIQRRVEEYYLNRDKGRGSGYKQWKRWEYLMERRLTPDGKITNYAARNWEALQKYQQEQIGNSSSMSSDSWSFLGPTNWVNGPSGYNPGLGRINIIAFHPTDADIIYVGAPSGGVWKTNDGGSTWTPLTDDLPVIGVSGIVVDYIDPNVLYLLTGDGDGGDTKTIGVLKSTNGGATWDNTGLSYSVESYVKGYKLAQHPTNNQILFSVQTDGLWKTTDGGVTWNNVLSGSFRDLEFKPGNPDIMYLSSRDLFYRSTDGGDTWVLITSGLPTGENRIAIGVSPANPEYVYLLCGSSTGAGSFKGVFRSIDSGLNFVTTTTTPNILGYNPTGNDNNSQSWYDLAIAVSRTNISQLITGGINTWRSTNFGNNFSITSYWANPTNSIGYTHADIHALEINPLDNVLYLGSDGGVFRSTDFGDTWVDLSAGLGIMQFYRIAGVDANPDLLIGGTQDNGSNKYNGTTVVTHMYGADGMDGMIDYTNTDILYFSYQYGGLRKSTNGGNTSSSIKPSGATGSWVTPYVMDPVNSSIIYGGYSDVYKSTNGGTSWVNTSADGRGALAIGTDNTDRLYAAYSGTIRTTGTGGGAWTDISSGLPGLFITFIAVNPENSSEVYVTLGSFSTGNKVFRSTNAGTTWENYSGTLPNVIVNSIAYENRSGSAEDVLYIGTDVGVFYRNSTSGDWVSYDQTLPNVPVFDLEINEINNTITAGTFGRGLWRSATATQPQVLISGAVNLEDNTPINNVAILEEIKDQYQQGKNYGYWFEDEVFRWQTFKPSSDNISEIQIYIQKAGNPGDILLSLEDNNNQEIWTGQILQDQSFTGWNKIYVVPYLAVVMDQTYKLIINASINSPSPAKRYAWRGQTNSTYDRGISDVEGTLPGFDYAFQIYSGEIKATTNTAGYYQTQLNYGWSGTLSPSYESGWTFNPPGKNYSNVILNQTDQNFTAYQELYLNVMLFLEGSYSSGTMNNYLNTQDLIPLTQPYNVSPWNYTGSETVASLPTDVVDWVLVELRSTETTIVKRRAAFLKNDGSLVDLDGSSYIKFQTVGAGDYYIVIIQRDHLPVMTANKITLSTSPTLYDMRTDINKAYGTNAMKDLGGGFYGMYSGDASKDGQIDADDRAATWNARNLVGYKDEDVTMDGQVDADDRVITWNNRNVVSQVPMGTTTAIPVKTEMIKDNH